MITFWIPLQYVPRKGSGLCFATTKTHSDFALPYWNPIVPPTENDDNDNTINNSEWNRLDERYKDPGYIDYYDIIDQQQQQGDGSTTIKTKKRNLKYQSFIDYMPLNVGDITVHSGWTLHCSNPCHKDEIIDRLALAITYVDSRAPIRLDAQQIVAKQFQQSTGSNNNNNNTSNKQNNNKKKANTIESKKNMIVENNDDDSSSYRADREDIWSYQDWILDVPVGTYKWDHPFVPILWPQPQSQSPLPPQ